ncbi:PepSY domain-containing protein [Alkalibacillus silvisoli]|uniref:PepSY domain-containing protein n=1 Tax=Alkalibacillus silvisoli TaxID=392823 RepID=A0ABN0ZMX7_9BACI
MRKKLIYSTFASTFVLGSVFGLTAFENKEQEHSISENKSGTEANVMYNATRLIGHDELEQIVSEKIEGQIQDVELNSHEQFEVKVIQGKNHYQLTVDGVRGKVVSFNLEYSPDQTVRRVYSDQIAKNNQSTIEKLDAIELALETVNGKPVKAELLDEEGELIYLVGIEYDELFFEVIVDAVSGVVLDVS